MEAQYDYEVVHVIREFFLIDEESYQRRYSRDDQRPLSNGYYMVTWPEMESPKRFDEHAVFHGPCATRSEALSLLSRLGETGRLSSRSKDPGAGVITGRLS
ncbi:MAG: hypothetical protein ACKVQA_10640 [Burkholderiales bacterium]